MGWSNQWTGAAYRLFAAPTPDGARKKVICRRKLACLSYTVCYFGIDIPFASANHIQWPALQVCIVTSVLQARGAAHTRVHTMQPPNRSTKPSSPRKTHNGAAYHRGSVTGCICKTAYLLVRGTAGCSQPTRQTAKPRCTRWPRARQTNAPSAARAGNSHRQLNWPPTLIRQPRVRLQEYGQRLTLSAPPDPISRARSYRSDNTHASRHEPESTGLQPDTCICEPCNALCRAHLARRTRWSFVKRRDA